MRLALPLLVGLLALLPGTAHAQVGRFRIEGEGPEGRYEGAAFVRGGAGGLRVLIKTAAGSAAEDERRGEADAWQVETGLRFTLRAERGPIREAALRADARRAATAQLAVAYRDAAGRAVRRETWTREDAVTVPFVVVALTSDQPRFPGISREVAARAEAQARRQLDRVYGPLGVKFAPVAGGPVLVDGAARDANGDGRLQRAEVEALRDRLEADGTKRPGRVVLVVTAAPFAAPGCRGWTLGDAPATPHSLGDVNDNLSLVGADYLDPDAHHTVAHEVGHQLGLDDLTRENRLQLARPDREDHLMESGGDGLFLDPAAARLVRRAALLPDHGLCGRRTPAPLADAPGLEK
jgi:hypothetical protein